MKFHTNWKIKIQVFLIAPVILTAICSCGFYWIKELTLLDARKLYTPVSAPSWKEEQVFSEVRFF